MITKQQMKECDIFLGLNLLKGSSKMQINIQSMQDVISKMKSQGKNGIIMSVNEFERLFLDVQKLQKEADWLAKECVSWMDAYFGEVATGNYDDEPSMKPEYWREKAREAVKSV